MAKTIFFKNGNAETIVGKLNKKDILEYQQSDFTKKALKQGFCYVISTCKSGDSSLQYFLKADEVIDTLLKQADYKQKGEI